MNTIITNTVLSTSFVYATDAAPDDIDAPPTFDASVQ